MKKNDLLDVKALDIKTLHARAAKLRTELADLVLDKNMDKLKDSNVANKKRKDLAQILTIHRQKTLLALMEKPSEKSFDSAQDLKAKKEVTK